MDWGKYTYDGPPPTQKERDREHRRERIGQTLDQAVELSIDAWESFEHSFKQPLYAMAQIADHAAGTEVAKNKWLSEERPPEEPFNTPGYWAQQTGSTLGSLPWFSLLHKAIGAGVHRAVGIGAFESMTTAQLHRYAVAEAMATGFTYGAVLTPTRNKSITSTADFAKDRFLTGSTTAATFGVSSIASAKITDWVGNNPSSVQKVATSFFSSAIGGGFDSEVKALRKHGRLATEKEFAKDVYTYAVIGAGMTTIHEIFPSTRSETIKQRDSSYKPDEKSARFVFGEFRENVRQAVLNNQQEASVMRITLPARLSAAEKPVGEVPAAPHATAIPRAPAPAEVPPLATPRIGVVPPELLPLDPAQLSGPSRIVFDRLQSAGLKPRIAETANGPEIRVPLVDLTRGSHPLLKQTIRTIDRAYAEQWRQSRTDSGNRLFSKTPLTMDDPLIPGDKSMK